jgi:hypothetical protein
MSPKNPVFIGIEGHNRTVKGRLIALRRQGRQFESAWGTLVA